MEPSVLRAIAMATLAGASTLIGACVVVFFKRSTKVLSFSLAFAGGVMMSVSFWDLYPHAIHSISGYMANHFAVLLCILLLSVGMLFTHGVDAFVPDAPAAVDENTGQIYRIGIFSMLALMLHNFPEGIATFVSAYEDVSLGVTITLAIALHNIPEGITVAMPVYYATGSRKKAFYYTFLSAVAEPAGAIAAFLVLRPLITPFLLGCVFAFVAGIMLFISIEKLLPAAGKEHGALWATFLGICLLPLCELLLP